jgi:hypothetical protein
MASRVLVDVAFDGTEEYAHFDGDGSLCGLEWSADVEAVVEANKRRQTDIANAKPDDDGPIAPVLRRVLDRLPESGGNKTLSIPAAGPAGESHAMSGRT